MEKAVSKQKQSRPATANAKAPPPAATPLRVPPLFRRIDWITFLVTTALVWVGYYLTLAPDLTLEDSGELAAASYYAGIPHPPGYPVWTVYTWLWTVLLPFKNIAWRVALGEATAAAFACGLLALLVSRGSSMLMEGIEDLKNMTGRWENAICMVSGFVSGMLLGFNGYMWSQSVIVEVYSFSLLSFIGVLLCLLRWIYAPHQRRYLYLAMFLFGICFTNHQTLIVAAMGIEVAIAAAQPKLGRTFFLGNSIVYIIGLLAKSHGYLAVFNSPPGQLNMVFVIFNFVGVGSIAAFAYLAYKSSEVFDSRDFWCALLCALLWIAGAAFYLYMPLSGMSTPPMQWGYPRTVEGFFHALTRGQYEKTNPTNFLTDPGRLLTQLGMLVAGIGEEFNWVYTLIALVPFLYFLKMKRREQAWLVGIAAIYLCLGVLLLILLNPAPERASRELVRVFFTASHVQVALLVGYGLTIIVSYMATHYQRFRVLGLVGGAVAVALALYELMSDTRNQYFGEASSPTLSQIFSQIVTVFGKDQYGLPVFADLILVAMTLVFLASLAVYRKRAPLAIALGLFALMPANSVLTHWSDNEQHGHLFGYWFGHDMFTPPFVGPDGKLSYDAALREQAMKGPNGHLVYPEMTKDAVLYGGTDPGRFCPTYTIFCESFIPPECKPLDPKYDRRDVYIITQNALADGTYLCYLRSQYNRSDQIDPPFFAGLVDMFQTATLNDKNRALKVRGDYFEYGALGKAIGLLNFAARPLDDFFSSLGARVEKRRRTFTSWFKPDHFTDLQAFAAKLRPGTDQDPLSRYLFENLSRPTQALLTGPGDEAQLRKALADDLNVILEREQKAWRALAIKQRQKDDIDQRLSGGDASDRLRRKQEQLENEIAELSKIGHLYDTNRFAGVKLSEYLTLFLRQNFEIERREREHPEIAFPENSARIRLNRLLLEEAYPGEIARSLGGVYPDREIYIASPPDSSKCFEEYLKDAQRRLQHDTQFPNEPRQLKPGEDVHIVNEGGQQRVQVSGQVAVMSINGLLTKVIFDHCPENEFFVEESFPLDWMYPHLTPYGIIMKINRQPLPQLSEEILQRDHEFWSQFSQRLIGNWITYDTSVKEIADFVEKVYLRRDFRGFEGDRKFVRDDQSQKAFSKLRSSIGGVYAWRVYNSKSPADQQRMIREADFAFRQAFAFCPYSPEAVFRYSQLLAGLGRIDDALLVVNTCLKLDPYSGQVSYLAKSLAEARGQQSEIKQAQATLQQLEAEVRNHPTNFQAAFNLAGVYMQMQQTDRALQILEQVQDNPNADVNAVLSVARALAQINRLDKLEPTLAKLVKLAPQRPEVWYDLAALKAVLGKQTEVFPALQKALELNAVQLTQDADAKNLTNEARRDARFEAVRSSPEFQRLVPPP